MKNDKNIKVIILRHLGIFAIFITYLIVTLVFNLGCPIRKAIHMPCPSCGMTRAWFEVLKMNFSRAFEYHPLFIFIPVYVWSVIHRNIWPIKKIPKKIFSIILVGGIIIIFGVYIYRIVFGFGIV